MFKKSSKTKQFNMFSSPSGLMCERESRQYDDQTAWHNKFYTEVTSKIDEEIFKPLYTTEREDNRVGRPNDPIRVLIAMMILKEGCGCSDEQLYEQCRFNLLYRRALGMVTLDEQCPTIESYYGLRRKICQYEEEHKENQIDFVANGLQGKTSRFDLNMTEEQTLEVTDKHTGEVQTAIPVKANRWKIGLKDANGRMSWRYFTKEQVDKAEVRRKVDSIPFEERKKRNNVEASIFQYSFHTRNNKTKYRTLIKHTLQAIARCAWINVRRLFWFDAKLSLQMAK